MLIPALLLLSGLTAPAHANYQDDFLLTGTLDVISGHAPALGGGKLKPVSGDIQITLTVNARDYSSTKGKAFIQMAQGAQEFKVPADFLSVRDSINSVKYMLANSTVVGGNRRLPISIGFNVDKTLLRSGVVEERTQWCGLKCNGGDAGGVICTPFGCFGLAGGGGGCVDAGYRYVNVTFDEYDADAEVSLFDKTGVKFGSFTSKISDHAQIITKRDYVSGCSTDIAPGSIQTTSLELKAESSSSRQAIQSVPAEF